MPGCGGLAPDILEYTVDPIPNVAYELDPTYTLVYVDPRKLTGKGIGILTKLSSCAPVVSMIVIVAADPNDRCVIVNDAADDGAIVVLPLLRKINHGRNPPTMVK